MEFFLIAGNTQAADGILLFFFSLPLKAKQYRF